VRSALRVLGVAGLLFAFAAPKAQAAEPPEPDPCRNLQIAGIAVTDDLVVGPLGVDFGDRCAVAASPSPEATPGPSTSAAPGSPTSSSAPRAAGTSTARMPKASTAKPPPAPASGAVAMIAAKAAAARPVSAAKERASARALAVQTKRRWALVTLLLIVGSGVVLHQRS